MKKPNKTLCSSCLAGEHICLSLVLKDYCSCGCVGQPSIQPKPVPSIWEILTGYPEPKERDCDRGR